MCGIIYDRIYAHLLKESELTLQVALNICRANEATSQLTLKPTRKYKQISTENA